MNQYDVPTSASHVSTTERRATRRSSAKPRSTSLQWWIVRMASATSKSPSGSGMASALAWIAGAAPGGRCAIIVAEGSMATTVVGGS